MSRFTETTMVTVTMTATESVTVTSTAAPETTTSYIPEPTDEKSLPPSATVGVSVLGGLLLALVLAGVIICLWQRHKRRRKGQGRGPPGPGAAQGHKYCAQVRPHPDTTVDDGGPDNMKLKLKTVEDV